MDTILTVRNEDLERLNPQEAVEFFRELVWAEATALGIGKHLINVPSAITVADGGIDAEIRDVPMDTGRGIIKPGLTRYQIKTGNFSPSANTNIEEILLTKTSKELKSRVKSCFDKGGTLVVVLFGWDNPDTRDDAVVEKFREKLRSIDEQYREAKIEVWRQNNIIGFLKHFPSLALQANGRATARFRTHNSWALDAEMARPLRCGSPQEEFISNFRKEIRDSSKPIHIFVWGEPGIGKTRLVLEATKADDLRPLIVYCEAASKFRDSNLMNEILREDSSFEAILVIDECDFDTRLTIWNRLMPLSPRIRLVSIYNEHERTSGHTNAIDVPRLEKSDVSEVIQAYDVPEPQAGRYAEFCGGLPRVAHALGQNLKNNPEDLLRPPDTVNIWERIIAGGDDPASSQVGQRRLVLQHLALFKRFGYERPFKAEAKAIADMIKGVDPDVTLHKFRAIVQLLRQRKVLQGDYTLYISTKMLHIYLWVEWWKVHGIEFDLNSFLGDLPETLRESFFEMFKYAAESEIASRFVERLMGDDGPFFRKDYWKTRIGARLFEVLAEADPKSALECLKKTVATWDRDELLEFRTGRREVVRALEMIAIWRDLFPGAARLLLLLGAAENEDWSNNASGLFTEFFSQGYGSLAPTEASPEERFPLLIEALESESKEARLLGLRACDSALKTSFFRRIGAEHQGIREEPRLWAPKKWGELFDAYRRVWKLLRDKTDGLEDDERKRAFEILLTNARGLAHVPQLSAMVVETMADLATKPYADEGEVLKKTIEILHFDGKELPTEIRKNLVDLRDAITGSGFSALMKRYVGMDIFEDNFDENGNQVDTAKPKIEGLAEQAAENEELLRNELTWLVTVRTQNVYRFGYELGTRDKGFSLLPRIIGAQREIGESTGFLGGYLRALFETDEEKWEEELESLAGDEVLKALVHELTWRSGMTDRAALRILSIAEDGIIDINEFRIFTSGLTYKGLSVEVFHRWIGFLLKRPESSAAYIALQMYDYYYRNGKAGINMPEEPTLQILTHQSFFTRGEAKSRDTMEEHYWKGVGLSFIHLYPERSLEVAEKMMEHFGEDGTIFSSSFSQALAVLNEITKNYPEEVWRIATKHLKSPRDLRAFHIEGWMRGGEFSQAGHEGILPLIPIESIWKWVDEDIKNRAWFLATFVPNSLFREAGKTCLAREVLVRHGEREDVRRNLEANFSTESWSGPASLHYQEKARRLLEFKEDEDNENVKRWIDEYVALLDRRAESERIGEERRGF